MYYACDDCDQKKFISWRAVACCPEHYQAYTLLWEYGNGTTGKDIVKPFLTELGAEGWANSPCKNLIDEIFANDVPPEHLPQSGDVVRECPDGFVECAGASAEEPLADLTTGSTRRVQVEPFYKQIVRKNRHNK